MQSEMNIIQQKMSQNTQIESKALKWNCVWNYYWKSGHKLHFGVFTLQIDWEHWYISYEYLPFNFWTN